MRIGMLRCRHRERRCQRGVGSSTCGRVQGNHHRDRQWGTDRCRQTPAPIPVRRIDTHHQHHHRPLHNPTETTTTPPLSSNPHQHHHHHHHNHKHHNQTHHPPILKNPAQARHGTACAPKRASANQPGTESDARVARVQSRAPVPGSRRRVGIVCRERIALRLMRGRRIGSWRRRRRSGTLMLGLRGRGRGGILRRGVEGVVVVVVGGGSLGFLIW